MPLFKALPTGVIVGDTDTQTLTNKTLTSPTINSPTVTSQSVDTINLTGGQIAFPAAQSASAGVNTLDDYEEGNFTVVLRFGGASVGITYANQTGSYIKIGQLVHFAFDLNLTSKGSSTGTATLSGLPFTCGSSPVGSGSGFFANMVSTMKSPHALPTAGATTVDLYSDAGAGSMTAMADTSFTNTSRLLFGGVYRASA